MSAPSSPLSHPPASTSPLAPKLASSARLIPSAALSLPPLSPAMAQFPSPLSSPMQPLPFSPAAVAVPFPFMLQSPVALLPLLLSDSAVLPPAPHRRRCCSSPDSLTRSERNRLYEQLQAKLSRAEEDRREREDDEQQLSSFRHEAAAAPGDRSGLFSLGHSPSSSMYAAAAQPRLSPVLLRWRSPAGDRRMSLPSHALADWAAADGKDVAAVEEGEEKNKAVDDEENKPQPAVDSNAAETAEEKEEEPLPRSSSLLTSSLLASLSLQKQAAPSAALSLSEYRPSSSAASAVASPSSAAPPHSRSLSSFSFLTNRRPSSPPLHSRAAPTFLDYLHSSQQQQTAQAAQHHHLPYLDYSSLPTLVTAISSSTTAQASRAAFLLTFPYFSDAATLADLLLCALFSPPPVDLTGRDRELGETEKKLMAAWRREKDDVLLTLQQWVVDYAEDVAGAGGIGADVVAVLRDWPPQDWRETIVDGMRETRERVVSCWEREMEQWEERKGKERLAAATDELQQAERLSHPLSSPLHFSLTSYSPSPFSLSSSVYNFSSMIIAQQLTLLTLDRFAAIQPRQLIAKQRVCLPPALNQMKLSNQTTLFIASHILALHPSLPSTPSQTSSSSSLSASSSSSSALRLSIFRKWIKVACILFAHCNWNGVFEVMYGLTHHAVYRLRLAHQLQREERDNYSKLTTFVSSDDNYGVYRRVRAKKATAPAAAGAADAVRLPYLGVVLKDLVAMEESQLVVRVEGEKAEDGRKRKQDDARAATRGGTADRGATGGNAVVSNGVPALQPSSASSPSIPYSRGPLLSVSSTTRCGASVSSESSLSSVNSIASSDSSSGGINVDSVESDLFGDDSSGSLVLPSLLSASLQSPPSAFPQPAAAASSVPNSSSSSSAASRPAPSPSPPPPLSPSRVFVNFTKCRQIHSLITETLQLPSRPPFPPLPDVQRMLTQGSEAALSEKQLMDMSLLIQPRSTRGAAGDGGGGAGSGRGDAGMGAERGGGVVVRRSGSPFGLHSLSGHLSDGLHALRDLSPAALSSPMRPLRGSASSSAIHSLLHHRER